MTVRAMTSHDATAAVPPQVRRSFPDPHQPPPVLRRPTLPTRRVLPPPATVAAIADATVADATGPIAACGSCLLVAVGPRGDLFAVDSSRPHAPRRLVGRHGARVTGLVVRGGLVFSSGCDGLVVSRAVGGDDDLAVVVGRHPAGVTATRFAPDGRLVTAGHDGLVLGWRDGLPELLATHDGGVEAVAVLAAGAVVTAGRDGRLLHRFPGGAAVELRQRRRELTVAVTPVGRTSLLTASGQRGVVRLWDDLGDGGWPEELGVHGGWVLALVTLDADHVAAVGGEQATIWDLRSGDSARVPLRAGLHATSAVALPGGALAVADADGVVEVLAAARLVQDATRSLPAR